MKLINKKKERKMEEDIEILEKFTKIVKGKDYNAKKRLAWIL